jgi:hypothetical protein
MSARIQLICLWSGYAFFVLYLLGIVRNRIGDSRRARAVDLLTNSEHGGCRQSGGRHTIG